MSEGGDYELLRRARSDPGAIGVLFRRHATAIERFLAAETLDAAVAAELTAEAFARALLGVRTFRGTTDAEAVAWLYGIARNLASNWRRRGRVESAARDDGETMAPAPGHAVVVAQFDDDILYRTPARDGVSICTEITAIGAGGASEIPDAGCTADTGDPHWPIGLQLHGFRERQLIVGQARGSAGVSLHLVTAHSDARIPLGVDGFFLWELPQQERPTGTAPDVMSVPFGALELRAADGSLVARMPFQAMLTPPPSAG